MRMRSDGVKRSSERREGPTIDLGLKAFVIRLPLRFLNGGNEQQGRVELLLPAVDGHGDVMRHWHHHCKGCCWSKADQKKTIWEVFQGAS